MSRAALFALVSFTSFGKEYHRGQEIPAEDYRSWPEETLPNRLNGGDVRWGKEEGPSEATVVSKEEADKALAAHAAATAAPIGDSTPPGEISTVPLTEEEIEARDRLAAERKAIEEDTDLTPTQRKNKLKKFDQEHSSDDGFSLP